MRRSNQDLQPDRATNRINRRIIIGRQDIKIFSGHDNQQARFDDINKRLRHEQMRVIKIQSLNVPLVQILAAITIGIVILIGTQMSARDMLSPGEFVAYITAMGMILTRYDGSPGSMRQREVLLPQNQFMRFSIRYLIISAGIRKL